MRAQRKVMTLSVKVFNQSAPAAVAHTYSLYLLSLEGIKQSVMERSIVRGGGVQKRVK